MAGYHISDRALPITMDEDKLSESNEAIATFASVDINLKSWIESFKANPIWPSNIPGASLRPEGPCASTSLTPMGSVQ